MRVGIMPQEIKDAEKFLQLAGTATLCKIKRSGNMVKLKLRTKKQLYTYATDPETADALKRKLTCEIIDL